MSVGRKKFWGESQVFGSHCFGSPVKSFCVVLNSLDRGDTSVTATTVRVVMRTLDRVDFTVYAAKSKPIFKKGSMLA